MTGDRDERALAARFALEGVARSWRGALIYCAFAAALLVLSAVFSRFGEPAVFPTLLIVRTVTLIAVALIVWALTTAVGRQRGRELAILLAVTLTLCLHGLAQATGGQASPQYERLTLLLLAPAILMSWNGVWSAGACAAVVATYLTGSAAVGQLHDPEVAGHVGRLLAVAAVAVGANVVRERQRWRELVQVDFDRRARTRRGRAAAAQRGSRAARARTHGGAGRQRGALPRHVRGGADRRHHRRAASRLPQANRSFAVMLGREAARLVGAAGRVRGPRRSRRAANRAGGAAHGRAGAAARRYACGDPTAAWSPPRGRWRRFATRQAPSSVPW
ncbi:MAG: hypothetical protein U0802_26250 [Candidatus Binatia bacterium]